MSNLTRTSKDITSFPQFQNLFATLPKELKNQIGLLVLSDSIALDCNYLAPQSLWKQLFLQIPFLWDLETDVICRKTSSIAFGGDGWNWEKLTRQVLSPITVPVIKKGDLCHTPWDYSYIGLTVPAGLKNRRRIWQIIEEMYPNDVGMHHFRDDEPENQIAAEGIVEEVSS